MTPGELLERVRQYYLNRLLEVAAERTVETGRTVIFEPAVVDKHGQPAHDGSLGLPIRLDLVVMEGGVVVDSIQVDTKGMLSFKPLRFGWTDSLQVKLCPFQWNCCFITVSPPPTAAHWEPVLLWYEQWFSPRAASSIDPTGIQNVVHFLSDLTIESDVGRFSVDLGTASVETLESLLDAISELGATEVVIGSTI